MNLTTLPNDWILTQAFLYPKILRHAARKAGWLRGIMFAVHSAISQSETDRLLRLIDEGTASTVGAAFFQALVRCLAEALNVRFAFVAKFTKVKTRVQTLALWDGRFLDNIEFDLDGTPCEAVLAGQTCLYRNAVQEQFPADSALAEWGAESYLAVPLQDVGGEVMGHLAMLDTKPMRAAPQDLSVFRIFAARAAAELERQKATLDLAQSEQRLTSILASATDAIITVDTEHHITLFNKAAERVFRCAAQWAIGQPFDRFLSRRFRDLLQDYMQASERELQQRWAPEGLTAVRADGEEFPVDATFSPAVVGGQRLFTIILRDVSERRRAAAEIERLRSEESYLQETLHSEYAPSELRSRACAMQPVLSLIQQVAPGDTTVLVSGETGTGKELIAHALHSLSRRKDKILVKFNCAALPSELIESELFGHEKGAFTGATAQRKGRFELSHGGTLFLDEVGELSMVAQAKLLRVMQEREFERVGGTQTVKVDVRLITASNRDLMATVKEGSFRPDLYYRLNVFPINVPPLRARTEDILPLARYFLAQFGRKLGKDLTDFSPDAVFQLERYSWPGNVRELQNTIERAAVLARASIIGVTELRLGDVEDLSPVPPTAQTITAVESEHIRRILEESRWVVEGPHGAAAILGVKPSTLRYRMKKLEIRRG
ncbi:MAG: sigma-54 interaction domain-containing protein [Gammaproteobacteria bacterium]